jgi:hypothetical protein
MSFFTSIKYGLGINGKYALPISCCNTIDPGARLAMATGHAMLINLC